MRNGNEWYVETILDMRFDASGQVEYLVKWSGNWPNDWRPAFDIEGSASQAINTYKQKSKGGGKGVKRKKTGDDSE